MPRKSVKNLYVAKLAEFILVTWKLQEGPRVVMWSNVLNAFDAYCMGKETLRRIWRKDEKAVHEHFKQYGHDVIVFLARQYRLTIITVGCNIRLLCDHGQIPELSEDKDRTPERQRTKPNYRKSLAGMRNPSFGFASFPEGMGDSHPLVFYGKKRNVQSGATHFINAMDQAQTAKDFGTLSGDHHEEIRKIGLDAANRIIEGPLPLFPFSREDDGSIPLDSEPDNGRTDGSDPATEAD